MEDLPFMNQKRRCQVRAIDYFPAQLEDFAVPKQAEVTTDEDRMDIDPDVESSEWEWSFLLLVEDASRPASKDHIPASAWIHVPNDAAQYLLQLDACE